VRGRENATVDLIRFEGRHVATTPLYFCDTDEAIANHVCHGRRRRAVPGARSRCVEHVSRRPTIESLPRVAPSGHQWREERASLRSRDEHRHELRNAQIAPWLKNETPARQHCDPRNYVLQRRARSRFAVPAWPGGRRDRKRNVSLPSFF
jgi:hypothetical protein